MWPELIGAGIGAISGLMGSGSDQPKQITQTTNSSTNSSAQAQPWAQAQPTYDAYTGLLNSIATTPLQYFQSPTFANNVVPASAATQQGWNTALGAVPYYTSGATQAMQGVPYYGQGANMMMQGTNPMMQGANMMGGAALSQTGMLGTANQNYGQLSNAADVANNPNVQNQLAANQQQVTQALNEQWLPEVQQQAVAGNAVGSSRQGIAQSQSIERAAQELANANANTMLTAYGQGLSAQQAALGMTPAMLQAQTAPAMTQYQGGQMMGGAGQQAVQAGQAYGAGAQQAGQAGNLQMQGAQSASQVGMSQEAYDQALLNEQRNAWSFNQQAPYQQTQFVGQGLNAFVPYASQTSSSQTTGSTSGTNPYYAPQDPFAAAIGGAMTGASLGNSLFGSPTSTTTPYPSTYPTNLSSPMYSQPSQTPLYYPTQTPYQNPYSYPYPNTMYGYNS